MQFRKCLFLCSFVIWLVSISLLLLGCSAEKRVVASPTNIPTSVIAEAAVQPTESVVETPATSTPFPSPTPTVEQSVARTDLLVIHADHAARLQEIARWQDRSAVNSVAFSPQANFIVWGNQEGQVVLVHLDERLSPSADEQPRVQWVAHAQRINSLKISPAGSLLATASEDYTVKLWSLDDQQVKKVFKGYEDGIAALAFSADEKWLAVSSYDFKVHLWKTQEQGAARDFSTKNTFAQGLAFSPDGKLLAVSANEWKASLFSIQLWQVINAKLIHKVSGFQERLNGLTFSPQGDWLAVGSGDDITPAQERAIFLINTSSAKVAQKFSGHKGAVLQVAFSLQQPLLASASTDGTVRLWSVPSDDLLAVLDHKSSVTDVAFSSDGKLLLSSAKDGSVHLWGIKP